MANLEITYDSIHVKMDVEIVQVPENSTFAIFVPDDPDDLAESSKLKPFYSYLGKIYDLGLSGCADVVESSKVILDQWRLINARPTSIEFCGGCCSSKNKDGIEIIFKFEEQLAIEKTDGNIGFLGE